MLYDCFLFNDELDILELRLQELYDYVDGFVLVEGAETFQRNPKPFYFADNKERFKPYLGKIIYVPFTATIPKQAISAENRAYEQPQRDAILQGLYQVHPEDVIIISDVDEIPSRETVVKLRGIKKKTRLYYRFHYYDLNYVMTWPWCLAFAIPYQHLLQTTPHYARHAIEIGEDSFVNAGWHFSFFGGNEQIRKKLLAHSESWLNTPQFTNDEHLDYVRQNCLDFANRDLLKMWLEPKPEFLPETIKANPTKYEALDWFK